MDNGSESFTPAMVFIGAIVLSMVLLLVIRLYRAFLFICRPNEVLIVSGKTHQLSTGDKSNFTVIQAGTHWRVPFVQTVYRMNVGLMPTELAVRKVLSSGGIPLDVHAVANVKVTTDPRYVYNAVERFLNVPVQTIRQTVEQTLAGALREVISQLTPEQVNEDRIEFANKVVESTSDVFNKMGLHLDTLKIQRVEDEAKYLVNVGRTQIANAIRDAENAEGQAAQEVAQEAAAARQVAELAQKDADIGVTRKRNELRTLTGQLEGAAVSVEKETQAAAQQARAEAEQELQTIRKELETKRLMAEIVLPAEAQRQAAELIAEGEAALPRELGLASAEVIRLMAEALGGAGPHAREILVLSQLDKLVAVAAEKVKGISVTHTHVVDSGDGRSLGALTSSYPASVTAMFASLKELTGVDVSELVSRRTEASKAPEAA